MNIKRENRYLSVFYILKIALKIRVLNLARQDFLYSKFAAIEVSDWFSLRYRVEEEDQPRILTLSDVQNATLICFLPTLELK